MRRLFLVLLCFILLLPVFGEDGDVVIDRKTSSFSFSGVLKGEEGGGDWKYNISVETPYGALASNVVDPDDFTNTSWLDGFTLEYTSNYLYPVSILLSLGPFFKQDASSDSTQDSQSIIPVKYRLGPSYGFVQGDYSWSNDKTSVNESHFKDKYGISMTASGGAVDAADDQSVEVEIKDGSRVAETMSFKSNNEGLDNPIFYKEKGRTFYADVKYTINADFQYYAGEGEVAGNVGDDWRYPDGTYEMDVYVTVECEV